MLFRSTSETDRPAVDPIPVEKRSAVWHAAFAAYYTSAGGPFTGVSRESLANTDADRVSIQKRVSDTVRRATWAADAAQTELGAFDAEEATKLEAGTRSVGDISSPSHVGGFDPEPE